MNENKTVDVVVTEIQMPFISMVTFMVKWNIVAIPTMIILTVFGGIFTILLSGFAIR